MITAIVECKDSATAPDAGHAEGVANATAAAVEMARLGIPPEHIVIPVFTTSGSHAQVGAVCMLKPSLPTVCFATRSLQLGILEDSRKAAKALVAMAHHAGQVQTFVENNNLKPQPDITMKCDSDVHHFKLMTNFLHLLWKGKAQSIDFAIPATNKCTCWRVICLSSESSLIER